MTYSSYHAVIKQGQKSLALSGEEFYKSDERKKGGTYLTATGKVKKVAEYERLIVMQDGTSIRMDDIMNLSGEVFSHLEMT